MFEIGIISVILLVIVFANNIFDKKKFFEDTKPAFNLLKEDDYEFLITAKYGPGYDADALFNKRVKEAGLVLIGSFVFFLNNLSFVNIIICGLLGYFVYKYPYINLKNYYKKHLHDIDALLPHYLKSLEILIQHYTVPVAITKSVDTAPEIFKEGLREMIASINAGDSSIDPYMAFAIKYPVRDSMRMMRLLYRLGLGNQENKQEQLITFTKSISSLQSKSREIKYKERLQKMEGKTRIMFMATGMSVAAVLLFYFYTMFA